MIGLGDKDIPDPELHGAELVVAGKAEKAAFIKRIDEMNSNLNCKLNSNSQNSLPPRVCVSFIGIRVIMTKLNLLTGFVYSFW